MRILALDLSMTSTGVAQVDEATAPSTWGHQTIKTGSRRKGERDIAFDLRRYETFVQTVVGLLATMRPELVAVEVTSHSHGFGGGKRTTKGMEFRAGLWLGTAKGWLHGALRDAQALGLGLPDVDLLESSEVKRRITGNQAASKDAVRAFLEEQLGWSFTTWTPDEVDALAVAMTASRNRATTSGSDTSALSLTPRTPQRKTGAVRATTPRRRSRPTRRRSATGTARSG